MARDILLFTQKRDPLKMATAYPLKAAESGTPGRRRLMAIRAYAAAKRTLTFADKLLDSELGDGAADRGDRFGRFRHALFGGGRAFQSLGHAPDHPLCLGCFILVAVAMIDVRVWMSLAYPAYGLALLLLMAVVVAGHVGLGAQRWITLGPLELQPSELMKISLVLALARFLHGKSVEEVSKPLTLPSRSA